MKSKTSLTKSVRVDTVGRLGTEHRSCTFDAEYTGENGEHSVHRVYVYEQRGSVHLVESYIRPRTKRGKTDMVEGEPTFIDLPLDDLAEMVAFFLRPPSHPEN